MSAVVAPKITWHRKTEWRFLKLSGAYVEGPVGFSVKIEYARDTALPEALEAGHHRLAAEGERVLKERAPWTDRTTDARTGLYGLAMKVNDQQYVVILSHGEDVEYGIWLEIANNGRFAVISPTQALIAALAPRVIAEEVRFELNGRGSKFRHASTGRFA